MKKGISICISGEINIDDIDKLISEVFPKTSKALDEEGFVIDDIELFDL